MSREHSVFYSNKVEILYNRLKVSLFNESISPFCRRIVIVPSPAIKSWLMLRLASDPEVGIATGIEVAYLDQTICKLCHFENIPNPIELALAIESEIRELIQIEPSEPVWRPLFNYLKVESAKWSKKSERRLVALSQHLASLFKDYGIYASQVTEKWMQTPTSNWQIELWKRLFVEKFNYPSKLLKQMDLGHLEFKRETRLYVFSISFMPKIYHEFMTSLADVLPMHYYQLSPCQLFWSDILSDRESRRLQEYWKKRGISKNQQQDLENFLREKNALLANFGRLGREMAQLMEDGPVITDELYALPESIREHDLYQNFLTDEMAYFKSTQLTALDVIQADMAVLRNPKNEERVHLEKTDHSIQIHSASSKMRETQIVYDILMGLIAKHSQDEDPICPEDIIVMAPDIMDYQALIKAVFGSSESQLDYHVLDLEMPAQNELIQAFMHLFELPKTRWDSLSILQLFEYQCFQRKQNLKSEDMHQLGQWVSDLGILWGYNEQHRNEILTQDYGLGIFNESNFGSWEKGFSRLLNQAVDDRSERSLSGTKLELAGQWIALIRELKEDLKPVSSNAAKTIKEWVEYFQNIAEKYLGYEEKEESHQPLFDQLMLLSRSERFVTEKKFGFSSIYTHLKESFCRERISFRETHLHAIRFCSMLPMRAIPAKVIVLMGMQEGAFPKQAQQDSLDLMSVAPEADYCPSATDYDRYLFLEALLSARKYFVSTFQNTCSESGKEQPPSLLITELMTYLEQACNQIPQIRHHPFHAYDASYFSKTSENRSFIKSQYLAAKACYKAEKAPQHLFVNDFTIVDGNLDVKEEIVIDLKQLTAMAKNPIKAYMNAALGMYLKEEENLETEEELVLSKLDQSILKKEAIYGSFEETITEAEQQGKLPPGIFKEVSVAKVFEDYEELKANYATLGVQPEAVFTIEFSEHCQIPAKIDNNLILPPLEVSYKDGVTVKIIGQLKEVCEKGLLSHSKKDAEELPKILPEFLVFQGLVDRYQLDIQKDLLLLKAGIKKEMSSEDPLRDLNRYLEYYFLSMKTISPLQPSWTVKLMKGNLDDVQKAIKASLNKDYSFDETMLWLCRQGKELDAHAMTHWQEHAEKIFGEPMKKWMA